MMPWINPQNEIYSFGMMDETKADIMMSHLEVVGFEMHGGHFSESGFNKEQFKRFDTIFSGHYHKKSDDGQIYYLGTPYQMTWSDYNCPKGFHVFDTETRELTRIVNKNDLYKFDKFTDKLFKADCHEVKIIEDFTDLDANTVSDDIVENTQDTMTLLGKYIDDLDVNLDKSKLKGDVSKLYHEAQDLEL